MSYWEERKAQKMEKIEIFSFNIPIGAAEGLLQIRTSRVANKSEVDVKREVDKEEVRVFEIWHSSCRGLVTIESDWGKDRKVHQVLSCGCGLRIEFPIDAVVKTIGELKIELEKRNNSDDLEKPRNQLD